MSNRKKQDLMEVAGMRLSQIWRDQDLPPNSEQIKDVLFRVVQAFPDLRVPDYEREQICAAFGRLYA
jgi:hypothetical protein